MPAFYAGLDVSLNSTSICIIDDTDKCQLETKVPSTPTAIAAALRFQSGQYDFKGHISRQGDASVRGMLYEAAFVLLVKVRKKSRLRDWGMRLREEKGFRIACVACARKMAVIMHRMWLTGEAFDPQHMPGLRATSA